MKHWLKPNERGTSMATRGAAARRYAQAVFDLARKAGQLDEWRADLGTLNAVFGSERAVDALEDPKLTDESRTKIIDGVFKSQKVSPLAINFLRLLAARRRLSLVPRIVEIFEE